ncbi:LysR substrate-binding domain-containing protein [Sphingomonas cavernae]|uniref:LysR family transcriptional regulator n=1 Tax=Sphingomonas cavernae TaxID=2320861 RepID=A0A418WND2_9SPHN|nr:LysR substrate-binding domain-containing protein [Sphingomonas cavernae]RJF91516.1 LysR family transcriptional regulator [Sphingomonas cavernae]
MRKLPPLAAVRVFEAAARHGNFTKAAEELGMTQAAVSYQVKLLEERIGTSLFHRVKRQVLLTETGKRIAPLISSAFDGIDDAFAIARTDNESVLTISCSNTFAQNWLALRLGAFQMQRPGLAVRLHTDDHVVDFARDEVDVAIRNSATPWPGLVSHFLMRVPIAPLASPEFLARHPPVRAPADILALPRLSSDDIWWGRWAEQTGAGAAVEAPRTALRLDSQLLEGNAAIAGHGVAILNFALWRNELRSGRLVQPLPDLAWGRGMYWLVYPPHKRNAPKIKAFRAWIEAEMRVDAADDLHGIFTPPADLVADA